MRRIRSKNMKPEVAVRRILHRLGYRFRLHAAGLPGNPDIIFRSRRKVIFVHGCFWHMHSSARCPIARIPKSNQAYWLPKLEKNRTRDKKTVRALRRKGWEVLTVWECELNYKSKLERRIIRFLERAPDT